MKIFNAKNLMGKVWVMPSPSFFPNCLESTKSQKNRETKLTLATFCVNSKKKSDTPYLELKFKP